MAMLSCPACGKLVNEGDQFCMSCGTTLESGPQPARERRRGAHFAQQVDAEPRQPQAMMFVEDMELAEEDDPSVRQRLLMLTQEEADVGCTKAMDVDGRRLDVRLPAGVHEGDKLDVEGWGYRDDQTGEPGPMRLSIAIVE